MSVRGSRILPIRLRCAAAAMVAAGFAAFGAARAATFQDCAAYAGGSGDNQRIRLADVDCTNFKQATVDEGSAPRNLQAQRIHGVEKVRARWNISGSGVAVGIWDGGRVSDTHIELQGRVTAGDPAEIIRLNNVDGPAPLHEHATHVAGTIGASGNPVIEAKGMAPGARIVSYTWTNDVAEMALAAANGITISSHSYGMPAGWDFRPGYCRANWIWWGRDEDTIDRTFGSYDDLSASFDKVVYEHPTLSVFVAAGNWRGDFGNPRAFRASTSASFAFNGTHCVRRSDSWVRSSKRRNMNTDNGGYDTMTGYSLSKNAITIGAAIDLPTPVSRTQIAATKFSSLGPTDDGRVKPDLVANGDGLFSTFLPSRCLRSGGNTCQSRDLTARENGSYAVLSGTSMATPVTSGAAALLNELASRTIGRALFADEMKAVLTHTATSPSGDGAPTYRYGWGLLDAMAAAELVSGVAGTLKRIDLPANASQPSSIALDWSADKNLKITVTWIDEAKPVRVHVALNDRVSMIANRLKIRLRSPGNAKDYFPWALDPAKPSKAATRATYNDRDNVIHIDVPAAERRDGIWHLEINQSARQSAHLAIAIAVSGASLQ